MKLEITWAAISHQGHIRAENQDCLSADGRLFAVADGMGGHKGGSTASLAAIEAVKSRLETSRKSLSERELNKVFTYANETVFKAAANNPEELGGMGTTLCVLYLATGRVSGDGDSGKDSTSGSTSFELSRLPHFIAGNVGDSRLYEFVSGSLIQITKDHNSAPHILTRAIGTNPRVKADIWKLEPFANAASHKTNLYLLCTDGLTNELSNDEISAVLDKMPFPATKAQLQTAAETLTEHALASGGRDNISIVLIEGTLHGL